MKMKLTREQISGLSDIELNRAMIWCYPPSRTVTYIDQSNVLRYYIESRWKLDPANYLTDYNLTMPMVFSNNLAVIPCMTGRYLVTRYAGTENVEAANKRPLRAICEVLLLIAMDGK